MGPSWRMWPCMPCSSVRAFLTPTRPGDASTVGESQPSGRDPEGTGEKMGFGLKSYGKGVEVDGTGPVYKLWSPVPGLTSPSHREVISSKEKSKYKFPPSTLPSEFSAFFQGQAQPLPYLAPPPNLVPLLQFTDPMH